jgi:hypothetical protein
VQASVFGRLAVHTQLIAAEHYLCPGSPDNIVTWPLIAIQSICGKAFCLKGRTTAVAMRELSTCTACRFRTPTKAYACGGSGSLFKSDDGGRSFKRDRGLDQVPANLYAVEFVNDKQGFVLGNDGILLRYIGPA